MRVYLDLDTHSSCFADDILDLPFVEIAVLRHESWWECENNENSSRDTHIFGLYTNAYPI
jgi:hypothetical protein